MVADWRKQWYDANPHAFHIQALGTLHSLPSPVPHTGQRIFKPAFFGALVQEQGARGALENTSFWLSNVRNIQFSFGRLIADLSQTGLWPRDAIVTELGGLLRALGRRAPHGHRAFSELVFGQDSMDIEVVNEGDIEEVVIDYDESEMCQSQLHVSHERVASCDYLEDDDIEDW
jgi:cell cycle checkpoint protein